MTPDPSQAALPPAAAALLTAIDSGEVLGASRQLRVLADCLLRIADASETNPGRLHADVSLLTRHVVATRGASSQAVTNGMLRMTAPVLTVDSATASRRLRASVADFRDDLNAWLAAVRDHGTRLLSGVRTVLAYDYSSTVAEVLREVAGGPGDLCVIVPEARSLDGGIKYLDDWRSADMTAHLIPDSAIPWALAGCDVVLIGAETLSAEGGCYNTIGTATTAHEAAGRGIPVYVLSVLLKTDTSPASSLRPLPTLDFLNRLNLPINLKGGDRLSLRGDFPDLDYTPPRDITGVVTENGILAPGEVGETARKTLWIGDGA